MWSCNLDDTSPFPLTLKFCFCGSFLLLMFHVYRVHAVLSVPCRLMITCWERADPLARLCVVFYYVLLTFPFDVPGQVWYLNVQFPDLCHPL